MIEEIKTEYIELTKKLAEEIKKLGLNVSGIKVEIDGNAVRNDYTVNIRHNI